MMIVSDTIVESDEMLTEDEEDRGVSRNEDEGEGGGGGVASLVHTPRFTSSTNIVLMSAERVLTSTRPPTQILGAAASENSGPVEANPIDNTPSGNKVVAGGGVEG